MVNKTSTSFDGPKVVKTIIVLVAVLLGFIAVKLLDLTVFSTVTTVFAAALSVAAAVSARRNGILRGVQFVSFSMISVAILFIVGASGLLTFSDQLAWSGMSAFAGVAAGSAVLKVSLDATRSNQ